MALDVKAGTFSSVSGAQTITVGFQPKLVMIFGRFSNTSYPAGSRKSESIGFSDGTNNVCREIFTKQGSWGRQADIRTTKVVEMNEYGIGLKLEAAITAFTTSGFTIDFTTHDHSETFSYLALGGADITDVAIGSFVFPTGSTHSLSLGFQPDGLILGSLNTATLDTAYSFVRESLGVYDGTTQFTIGEAERGDGTKDRGGFKTGAVAVFPDDNTATSSTLILYELSAAFSTTGVDFTKTVGGTSQSAHIFAAIKGPSFKVGSLNSPAATGNQSVTGIGFQPAASLFLFDGADTTAGTFSLPDQGMLGISDATSDSAIAIVNNNDSYEENIVYSSAKSVYIYDYASGLLGDANVASWDADGFNLNWTTVPTTNRTIGYLNVGPAGSGGGGSQVSASTISATESQQAARSQIAAMIENAAHAGLQRSAVFECIRVLMSAHLCGMESTAEAAVSVSSSYSALTALSAVSNVNWEFGGRVLVSTRSAIEAAQTALMTVPSGAEAQSMVTPASSSAVETLSRLVTMLATSYEARGIATAPVSTAVAVAIEALQPERRSPPALIEGLAGAVRLSASPIEALRLLGISGISPVEALAMVASLTGVQFEVDGAIVAVNYHDLELLLSASESIEAILSGAINLH